VEVINALYNFFICDEHVLVIVLSSSFWCTVFFLLGNSFVNKAKDLLLAGVFWLSSSQLLICCQILLVYPKVVELRVRDGILKSVRCPSVMHIIAALFEKILSIHKSILMLRQHVSGISNHQFLHEL
jgi:hypothetical protein